VTTVTFIIPVRHPDNASDWSRLKANLTQTVASIASQTHDDWRGIIVANTGSDLPPLPHRFSVEWVDFPANDLHEKGTGSREDFLDAFRFDKGRRVLKGMLRARDSRFFMIVDDDDFVSSRIVDFVAAHLDANGWTVEHGYVWDDGGNILFAHDEFNRLCGTCLIIRSELYKLPPTFEAATPDYIKYTLGGHFRVPEIMAERGTPLASLPFRGAVYRVGQRGSHSQTPTIFKKYIMNAQALRQPRQLWRDLKRLRFVGDAVRREFFGLGVRERLLSDRSSRRANETRPPRDVEV